MRLLLVGILLVACTAPSFAQTPERGIVGRPAPSLEVAAWRNLPKGQATFDVSDAAGRVLVVYCFQSWCPGCHSRGFPTLQKLIAHYDGRDDVKFAAVQTVFEGFGTNTPAAAWSTGKRYGLDIPIGHSGAKGKRAPMMRSYRTGGTPWLIIIDRAGVVRRNGFHVADQVAINLIDTLIAEPAPRVDVRTLPASRGGQDVVGTTLPAFAFDATSAGARPRTTPARITLYRWFTDDCPYCVHSLPALERLRKEFEPRGLRIVCVYHPKPARADVPVGDARRMARKLGFRGELAVDGDWSELRRAYLSAGRGRAGRRPATSVSLLADAKGVVRFVHPGPEFFPVGDGKDERANADYAALRRAVETLLAAGGAPETERAPGAEPKPEAEPAAKPTSRPAGG